ncbi:MAG: AAA family ATPase [Planctomycetota bacterium]
MSEGKTETAADIEARIRELRSRVERLRRAVEQSFLGHRGVVDLLLYTLLADGHALLEGAPGLGKTTLVKGLARALDLSFQRIQFTPDLVPADILGTRILEETAGGGHAFRFERGPIFGHLILADEVNRATPRTQSALLEAMQERQVTVFGETWTLEEPFCVIATQNPIEMEGTYPLPEAQLDRFLCKVEIKAPPAPELVAILAATTGVPAAPAAAVLRASDVLEMRRLVREVPVSSEIARLVAALVIATDPGHPHAPRSAKKNLRYGASPRGGQAVILLAKAKALLAGRAWVSGEDVEALAAPALRHRLVFSYEGEASGVHPDEIVAEALAVARAGE